MAEDFSLLQIVEPDALVHPNPVLAVIEVIPTDCSGEVYLISSLVKNKRLIRKVLIC